jgi:hypothetical protein
MRSPGLRDDSLFTSAGQEQFELLVRHLLDRFFNNEIVSVDGESLALIMTAAWAIALPTLIAAIFMFPAYHGFPPKPPRPPFWAQVSDRYFYGMYAWVVMGAITVFEWDLLVPDKLDVFVLSVLPISNRRLRLARVVAVLIFLGLFLMGTSSLGIIFFPLATEPAHVARAFAAHFAAVTVAGLCGASQILALQGLFISVFGARLFRAFSTLVQSFVVLVLSIALFLLPVFSRSLGALVQSGSVEMRSFPPFWFLGIYESILGESSGLPEFTRLAHTGYWATSLFIVLAMVTYPIAYKRSTRQAVEGSIAPTTRGWLAPSIASVLHVTVIRTPSGRAVYHFINQTLLRSQRHRLFMAMYAGVGIALACAAVVVLRVEGAHIGLTVSTTGIRLAVPALTFWIVAGLCTALLSPADPAGAWVFRLIHGKASSDQLRATRVWVLVWALTTILGVVTVLCFVSYSGSRGLMGSSVQVLVAAGVCLLLADAFLLRMKTIPFTEARVPRNTDLAFILLRYIVFFPLLVLTTVQYEPWIESSVGHLVAAALLVVAVHFGFRYVHWRLMRERANRSFGEEDAVVSPVLGLPI